MAKTKYKDKDKVKPVGPRARNDAYVMMLFITFLAIVAGTVLVYLDHDEYGKLTAPNPPQVQASDAGTVPAAAPKVDKSGGANP